MLKVTEKQVYRGFEAGVIIGDGHTIYDPAFYEGFDVSHLVFNHASDLSSGKTTIFGPDGVPKMDCPGVYNLDFLYWLKRQTGVLHPPAFGRGTDARRVVAALREWCGYEAS